MFNIIGSSYYSLPLQFCEGAKLRIKKGVRRLSDFSRELDVVKFARKIAVAVLDIFEYIPIVGDIVPTKGLKNVLRPLKIGIEFLMGFRALDAFLSCNVSTLNLLVLNVSGLALFVFSGIEILENLKFKLRFIHEAAAKVPIVGVFPFAGLLNLAFFGLWTAILIQDIQKRDSHKHRWDKADGKLEEWNQPLDRRKVANKIEHYDQKIVNVADQVKKLVLERKKNTWIAVQEQFDRLKDPLELLSQYKVDKWAKRTLEKRCNRLLIVEGWIGIGGLLITSALIVSGIGGMILGGVGLAIAVPEIYCGIRTFFLKLQINRLNPVPVVLEVIRRV